MGFLDRVETRLDLSEGIKKQVLRELASHYDELKEELLASGMSEVQVEGEAEKRLGNPSDVAARLNATHNSASWKSALICAVPFIGSILCLIAGSTAARFYLAALFGAVFSVGCARELIKGRRPVWLPVWLAGVCSIGVVVFDNLRFTNETAATLAMLIGSGILALIVLAASWHVRLWRKLSLCLCVPFIGFDVYLLLRYKSIDTANAIAFGGMLILGYVLIVLFARSVFEQHTYGNPLQASLFLLSLIVLDFPAVSNNDALLLAIQKIGCALVVVWLARASTTAEKTRALWLLMGFYAVIYVVHSNAGVWFVSPGYSFVRLASATLLNFFVLQVFLMIPIWSANRRRHNRPSIVR